VIRRARLFCSSFQWFSTTRRLVKLESSFCFGSSFRRKPESSVFALDLFKGASLRFSARIRASGSLSLACARESNQREHTPGAAPPAAVRKVRPGFARWASCPFANSRASLRATLSGDSGLPSPRLTGPWIKSNDNSKSGFASAFRFSLLRAGRARSALPGDPWPCGGSGRKGPQGRREGSRRFRCCTGCAISGTRPMTRTLWARCPKGARRWGVFLWFLSLHEQRKEPARRRRVEAFAFNENRNKQKQEQDSRLRGNDEQRAKAMDSGLRRNDEQKSKDAG